MTKTLKILICVALALIVAGALLSLIVFATVGFDAGKIGAGKLETKSYTVEDAFDRVAFDVKTADVTFFVAEDGVARIECYESEKQPHTVEVTDGKLTVTAKDDRTWYEKVSIISKTPKIKAYLPATAYAALSLETDTGDVTIPAGFDFGEIGIKTDTGDVSVTGVSPATLKIETDTGDVSLASSNVAETVKIDTDTGDVKLNGVTCRDLSVETNTGKVQMTDVECASLAIETDTGDVVLKNVVGTGAATIKTDTGDVKFDRCDAASYKIKTDTGDVEGTLRSGKLFTVSSRTGSIRVPEHDRDGGEFNVSTATGDIEISIAK